MVYFVRPAYFSSLSLLSIKRTVIADIRVSFQNEHKTFFHGRFYVFVELSLSCLRVSSRYFCHIIREDGGGHPKRKQKNTYFFGQTTESGMPPPFRASVWYSRIHLGF